MLSHCSGPHFFLWAPGGHWRCGPHPACCLQQIPRLYEAGFRTTENLKQVSRFLPTKASQREFQSGGYKGDGRHSPAAGVHSQPRNSTDMQVMGIKNGLRAGPRGFEGQQKRKDASCGQGRLPGVQGLGRYLTGGVGEGAFRGRTVACTTEDHTGPRAQRKVGFTWERHCSQGDHRW